MNPIFYIDFYKVGHVSQYPPGITKVYSNWTPRGSRTAEKEVVHFGLQYFIKHYLQHEFSSEFFCRPLEGILSQYREVISATLGDKNPRTDHIEALHRRGYLPIKIYSLPEGSLVPLRTPALVIVNTEDEFYWLPNYLETLMSSCLWMPSTSATTARAYRRIFLKYAREFGESDLGFVDWQGHDFSLRGMAGMEAGILSGMGHLTVFSGTDTVPAIMAAHQYYDAGLNSGGSVPATEHSVMCAGSQESEFETFKRLITEVYPTGIVSIVSDTWSLWNVLTNYLPRLRDIILARDGKIVIRPDCYDTESEILTDSGFVNFNQLQPTMKVAQYWSDGSVDFVVPRKIVAERYDGLMVKFWNDAGHIDLQVTPNHRMVQRMNYHGKRTVKTDGSVRCVEAQKARYSYFTDHIHGGVLKGTVELTPIERIWIAFQADGSYQTKMLKNHIRFNFTKQRKVERMRALCIESGVSFKESVEPSRPRNTQFYLTLPEEAPKKLDWVLPKLSSISGLWASEFIEEMSHWDATRRSKRRFKFDTTVAINAEAVQVIAALAGYRTKFTVTEDNRDDKFSDVYTVHICLWDKTDGQSVRSSEVPYKGNIFCVTVPSGMVVVRRNNCVSVSGNSGDPVKILCGDPDAKDGAARAGTLRLMAQALGTDGRGHINKAGAIYGDAITLERADQILERLTQEHRLSPYNVVFGIGSYTYQMVTRDTYGFAMKATAIEKDGQVIPIFKDPITDDGEKKSLRGIPIVLNGVVSETSNPHNLDMCDYYPVFVNGELLIDEKFCYIRRRVRSGL